MTQQLASDIHPRPAGVGAPARAGSRSLRVLVHEWTVVAAASILLAVAMTWPAVKNFRSFPVDPWDPSLQSWQMAWTGWSVKNDIGQLWDTNVFLTDRYALAYSDTLLGFLPFSLIGTGVEAAIVRYNILFLLAFALCFFGAYVLARQLGSRIAGAALAGAVFAYAPWRWTQASHLNILSVGGIALCLAMLARGHGYSLRDGYRPERVRPGWALAGWLVAAWQVTLGFGLGMPFGYLLGLLVVIAGIGWVWKRPEFSRRLLALDAAGMVAFAAVTVLMAVPYFRVLSHYNSQGRGLEEILSYSPPFRGFLTAPPMSLLWGDVQHDLRESFMQAGGWESILLPGFALYALAVLGLVLSAWPWRRRLLIAAVTTVVLWAAMGLRAPVTLPYRLLWEYLPGWAGIRVPGRLVVFVTLLLAVLAAGAVTAIGDRLAAWLRGPSRERLRPAVALLGLLPISAALVEGVATVDTPPAPRSPVAFREAQGPMLVLPTDWMDDQVMMLWSADGFPRLMNGQSGFVPPGIVRTREVTKNFPDQESVQYLRENGVRTVVVLRRPPTSRLEFPPDGSVLPEKAYSGPIDGLGLTRQETPDAVVYLVGGVPQ
ncbi:hypothetical protein [Actinoplanes sp. GCM10030250]|uniref:hypothetical protein n=1 Tax=Actinoplanes sp. GCM10030250 TaxID=3273376 RepID=UPI00361F9AD5